MTTKIRSLRNKDVKITMKFDCEETSSERRQNNNGESIVKKQVTKDVKMATKI